MKKRVTAEAIQQYAVVSRDTAAIHLDDEAATRAGFKRPIAHGMYIMGLAQSLYISEHPTQWITEYDMKFQKSLLVGTISIFDFETNNGNVQVTVTTETGDIIASGNFSVRELQ